MRRRNAKNVTFGSLSFVEASDYEYSDDEDDEPEKPFADGEQQSEEPANGAVQEPDDDIAVAPLNVGGAKKDGRSPSPDKQDATEEGEAGPRRNGVDSDRASRRAVQPAVRQPRSEED